MLANGPGYAPACRQAGLLNKFTKLLAGDIDFVVPGIQRLRKIHSEHTELVRVSPNGGFRDLAARYTYEGVPEDWSGVEKIQDK